MQYVPELGKIIEGEARRDAIHIAVAPLVAGMKLWPGERVGIAEDGRAVNDPENVPTIGIVDPYLTAQVEEGQRFWICLYPNTVTSLRHVWQHWAFKPKPPGDKNEKG